LEDRIGKFSITQYFEMEMPGIASESTSSRPFGTFRLSNLYPGLRPGLSSAVPAGLCTPATKVVPPSDLFARAPFATAHAWCLFRHVQTEDPYRSMIGPACGVPAEGVLNLKPLRLTSVLAITSPARNKPQAGRGLGSRVVKHPAPARSRHGSMTEDRHAR
jgi:hypothetical protein